MTASSFSHIYWLGGSPCSGKSSVAKTLAERYGLRYYSCDEAFYRHAQVIQPEAQPTFYRLMHYSPEELWMRPAAVQEADEFQTYREEFSFILDDLRELPTGQPILAEGAALLPELVAPLLPASRRAFWMVPAPAFQLDHYSRRDWARDVVKDCSDPVQAFGNWMERDIRFADKVAQQTEALGLGLMVVDGSRTLEENTAFVEAFWKLTPG
jgi:hypothetical protein